MRTTKAQVHKAQALSLPTAIVDAGSACFGTGMIYVALSRVTALSGLRLIALDKSKILCDAKTADEYKTLRAKFTPQLCKRSTIRCTLPDKYPTLQLLSTVGDLMAEYVNHSTA